MKFHFLDSEDIHDFYLPCNLTSHIQTIPTKMESLGKNKNCDFLPFFWLLILGHYQYYRSQRHYHYRPIENLPLTYNLSIKYTRLHCKKFMQVTCCLIDLAQGRMTRSMLAMSTSRWFGLDLVVNLAIHLLDSDGKTFTSPVKLYARIFTVYNSLFSLPNCDVSSENTLYV